MMAAQAWVALVLGLLTSAGVIGTLWQRQHSERVDREHRLEIESWAEWWRRFQWAAEQSISLNGEGRLLGMTIVQSLTTSPLLTGSERGIVESVLMARGRRWSR
ncbi:hypothetical protein MYK68_19895 [Gordonia sp. PP30]|uniref:hypothetical protein n=1 Tax=Gordonia sp. PP30 TaxID=2935861 RepID=UPI001FFEF9B2|nr:hypothetical protein [Gordonia sp. PP30]UQE74925.1 hypothetical protein MYK68_19895 [Gordonia sp. PP30]